MNNVFYIDIKGGFSKFHDATKFSMIQKIMWNMKNIYIYKIVPQQFFKKTWVPQEVRYTPKKKLLRKKYKNFKTIKEYICQ